MIFYEHGKKYNCRIKETPYFRKTATIGGKRRWFYGDGEKDANNKIEEAKQLAAKGLNLDERTAKVDAVFTHWLFNVKRIEVKASSFTRYECTYRTHIAPYPIVNMVLSKLDSGTLQAHINYLWEQEGLTASTIAETAKVWKMFLTWAHDEGYLVKNPSKKISLPKKRATRAKAIEVFTQEERTTMLNYMNETNYYYAEVIKLAFATGMRQGELLGLRWSDIYDHAVHVERSTAIVTHINADGERNRRREVWDTKTTNSVRVIPITPETEAMLNRHKLEQKKYMFAHRLPQSEYVFTSTTGALIDARTFIRSYERMLKRAGVPYRKFHAIRHTFATEAIRRGVDAKDLQMLLGHSDIETTYIYVQSDDTSKREAIQRIGAMM